MLVLERKLDQIITIGNDITIQIVKIQRGSVRLGITAPEALAIHRWEKDEIIDTEGRDGRSKDSV